MYGLFPKGRRKTSLGRSGGTLPRESSSAIIAIILLCEGREWDGKAESIENDPLSSGCL